MTMVEETSIELGDPISMSEPTASAVTDLQIETPEERFIQLFFIFFYFIFIFGY